MDLQGSEQHFTTAFNFTDYYKLKQKNKLLS